MKLMKYHNSDWVTKQNHNWLSDPYVRCVQKVIKTSISWIESDSIQWSNYTRHDSNQNKTHIHNNTSTHKIIYECVLMAGFRNNFRYAFSLCCNWIKVYYSIEMQSTNTVNFYYNEFEIYGTFVSILRHKFFIWMKSWVLLLLCMLKMSFSSLDEIIFFCSTMSYSSSNSKNAKNGSILELSKRSSRP